MSKVIAIGCGGYDLAAVTIKLEAALEALGGIHHLIPRGSRVFLKVNLLTGRPPEEAVTTHPVVVQAVAALLKDAGMEVVIGDSPAGPFTAARMKQIYRVTGMEAAAADAGVFLNENLEASMISHPQAHRLKQFEMLTAVQEADVVISLCKMKTHSMTLMTGAVKNLFGVMPGLTKAALHFRFPQLTDFAHAMVDICEKVNPVLSIMDGIEGMEGAGPSAGTVTPAGVLLLATNPHQLDLAAARWMGISPDQVPLLAAARERGLYHPGDAASTHSGSLPAVEWVGLTPEAAGVKPFQTPAIHEPDFLRRYQQIPLLGPGLAAVSNRWLRPRPVVIPETCIGCSECRIICPAAAITMVNRRPEFDLTKCIRCFCCQEVCPAKAIEIYRSALLKKITP